MLNSLVVGGLKSVRDIQRVPLAPITLIYGPNSAGKSTVIQSLLLLSQSVDFAGRLGAAFTLRMRGSKIDLGSFLSAIHRHDPKEAMTLGVEVTRAGTRQPIYVPPSARGLELANLPPLELRVTFTRASSSNSTLVDPHLSLIQFSGQGAEPFNLDFVPDKEARRAEEELDEPGIELPLPREDRFGTRYKVRDEGGLIGALKFLAVNVPDLSPRPRRPGVERRSAYKQTDEDVKKEIAKIEKNKKRLLKDTTQYSLLYPNVMWPRFLPKDRTRGPVDEFAPTYTLIKIQTLLGLIGSYVEDALESVSYLGPLRSHPERYYVVSSGLEGSVGVRGQNVIGVLVRQDTRRAMRLEELVSRWFKRFEIPYKLKVRSVTDTVAGDLHVLELTDLSQRIEVSPSDVGFGFSQLLPILVEGLLASTVSRRRGATRTICVEQPEIHLHPRLQAHIADFLIDTAGIGLAEKSSREEHLNPLQWIVETHSEALMLRIQRRIREGTLPPGAISVVYVKQSPEGDSKIIPLEIAENGDFVDEWPDGFFEEGYRERFPTA